MKPRKPLYDGAQKHHDRQMKLYSKFEKLGEGVQSSLRQNNDFLNNLCISEVDTTPAH